MRKGSESSQMDSDHRHLITGQKFCRLNYESVKTAACAEPWGSSAALELQALQAVYQFLSRFSRRKRNKHRSVRLSDLLPWISIESQEVLEMTHYRVHEKRTSCNAETIFTKTCTRVMLGNGRRLQRHVGLQTAPKRQHVLTPCFPRFGHARPHFLLF